MPWVEERDNGTYRLVVDLEPTDFKLDENGNRTRKKKRVRKTKVVHTKSKRVAEKELIKFMAELGLHTEQGLKAVSRSNKVKMETLIERWKQEFVLVDLEDTTQTSYLHHAEKRILPYFKDAYINDITSFEIIEFIQDLKELKDKKKRVGAPTKVYVYRVMKSMFVKATEWYGLKPDPMSDVPKPKEPPRKIINVYDEEESNLVFSALESGPMQFKNGSTFQFGVLISLAFTMGMRRAELLGLEWKHINFEKRQIEIRQSIPNFKDSAPNIKRPKNESSIRRINIPESLMIELQEYKAVWDKMREDNSEEWVNEKYSFLFCHPTGMPYYPKTITDKWRSFVSKHGLRYIRFHDIRHTSVTILINRGIHAKIISKRIGHSKIGTTMDVYGHVIESADVAAAAVFDDVFAKRPSSASQGGTEGGK